MVGAVSSYTGIQVHSWALLVTFSYYSPAAMQLHRGACAVLTAHVLELVNWTLCKSSGQHRHGSECDAVACRGEVDQKENGTSELNQMGFKGRKQVTWLSGDSTLTSPTQLFQDAMGRA